MAKRRRSGGRGSTASRITVKSTPKRVAPTTRRASNPRRSAPTAAQRRSTTKATKVTSGRGGRGTNKATVRVTPTAGPGRYTGGRGGRAQYVNPNNTLKSSEVRAAALGNYVAARNADTRLPGGTEAIAGGYTGKGAASIGAPGGGGGGGKGGGQGGGGGGRYDPIMAPMQEFTPYDFAPGQAQFEQGVNTAGGK